MDLFSSTASTTTTTNDLLDNIEITTTSDGPNWFCNAAALHQQINQTEEEEEEDHNKMMWWPFEEGGLFPMAMSYYYHQSKQLCISSSNEEFKDLENFDFDFTHLPPLDQHFEDQKQPHHQEAQTGFVVSVVKKELQEEEEEGKNNIEKKKTPMLPSLSRGTTLGNTSNSSSNKKMKKKMILAFDEIKKHFGVPISVAAKEMKVGMTHLKRRCRELKVMRWPHRKLKSLELLIHNLKEMGLANEVAMLEKHKKMVETLPGMELSEEVKKLRQASFKADYMKKKRQRNQLGHPH